MITNRTLRYITTICLMASLYNAVDAMNVVRPYKFFFNPAPHYGTRWQLFLRPEYGFNAKGYNPCSCSVNIAQIWQAEENALAMLNGFDAQSAIGQERIRVDAIDDGVRGQFDVFANLNVDFGCTLAARRALPHNIMLGIYMPVFTMQLKNVHWIDKTKDETAEDIRVHEYLTDHLAGQVSSLGCLNIGSWRRTGLGDMSIVADWLQDFVAAQPVLRNVRINGRLGLTLPTGKRENINEILAIPFGYNGAVTMIFGGGLNLALGSYIHIGFDVELREIFGNTSCQRIKTDLGQTELLLLQKASVYTDYGMEQQYTLYGELYDLVPHTSCKLAYQFFKRGDSLVSLYGNCFSNAIANTAERIQERNWHEILATATYDFAYLTREYVRAIPSLSLYAEIPFRGKRVAVCPILGAIVNVDF